MPETVVTYLNLGPIQQQGHRALRRAHLLEPSWTAFANYSFQDTPEVLDAASEQIQYPIAEVGVPAKNRFNLGLNWNGKRYLGSVSLNYCDKAFWNDVLTRPTTATPTPTPS